jgi:hypothetical protein
MLGIVVKDGAWVGNLLVLGTGDEETSGTTELAGSIDGRLDEDGATENVGLLVGNLVLVGDCEELGDGVPTGGRFGFKVRVGLVVSAPVTINDG